MKIQFNSDLHYEFGRVPVLYKEMVECDADVIVIAGDCSDHRNIKTDLIRLQRDSMKDVVFVPGNHEYYGTSRRLLDQELLDIHNQNDNVHVLIEDSVQIGDVVFHGSTGWWDGSFGPITSQCIHGLNDFRFVYDLMDKENENGIMWGKKSYDFFLKALTYGKYHNKSNIKTVCVTHHMPSPQCIHPQYVGSPINPCFSNNWEDLINTFEPDVWISGHTHTSYDFMIGKTRMVCNPQGYPSIWTGYEGESWTIENLHYNSCKIIEV